VADPRPGTLDPAGRRQWHQQRLGRPPRPDRGAAGPADGRRRGRDRPVAPEGGPAPRGPAQGRPPWQQDRNDPGVRRRHPADRRGRVGGDRQPVWAPGQVDPRAARGFGCARAADGSRRHGGRRVRGDRDDRADRGRTARGRGPAIAARRPCEGGREGDDGARSRLRLCRSGHESAATKASDGGHDELPRPRCDRSGRPARSWLDRRVPSKR
jgi:hypothetical protein